MKVLDDFGIPKGPLLFSFPRFADSRGVFTCLYEDKFIERCGVSHTVIKQLNLVSNQNRGTIRGLHFQKPPFNQGKIISVASGSICDVALDIRTNSPSYGKYARVILKAFDGQVLWVPTDFAHGYCPLEDNTNVIYAITRADYKPEYATGINPMDPTLQIDWGIRGTNASPRDIEYTSFEDFISPFLYGESNV
jgi:dTDP-4-dehydrorhamnose 3,5-epimerase